jgi:hypothetical protein
VTEHNGKKVIKIAIKILYKQIHMKKKLTQANNLSISTKKA